MIPFDYFVKTYYRKLRGRTGDFWMSESVALVESMKRTDTQAYFNYCDAHPNFTDEQLIALSPDIVELPGFGISIQDNPSIVGLEDPDILNKKLGEITVKQFLALK